PRAEGNHNDTASFERSLLRVRMEGRADALIGRRHPALRAGLTPAWFRVPDSPAMRWLRDTAFQWPRIGAQFARLLESLLGPLQWLRLRKKWRRVHGAVRAYWYSRGVADELGTLAALEDFLLDRRTGGGMLLDLDLAPGI